ncbi:MAG: hybrid sensor histidine kinase/response regulator [Deltaproteobacteria bacterium]|nr:hybrid sensor histidine kinase/response regulator [Deltaproteobacteria bacterium]
MMGGPGARDRGAQGPGFRLEAAADALSRISHELKTPLVTIKGYAELLLDQGLQPLDPTLRDWVRRIAAAANRLDTLVRRVANEERAASEGAIHPVAVSPGEWLARAVDDVRQLAATRALRWSWGVAEGIPSVALDPQAGRDLLLELLQNAARSTPDGGEVRVEASAEARGGVPGVRVAVRDSGVGVPAGDEADRLFTKFTVLGDVSAHHSGDFEFGAAGLGLGLAVVRATARAHGGEAWAEGTGRDPVRCPGAVFCVWLPAASPGLALAAEAPSAAELPRGRLLVVDPDPETRHILHTALTDAYDVETAATAAAALRAWEQDGGAWDACVFDPRLPDAPAVAFVAGLRRHPRGARAVVLCYHFGAEVAGAEALRAAGVDMFLSKPVRTRVLLQRLAALRSRR